jgi:hypothetical protein
MSISRCVALTILVLILSISANAQLKAGTLKLKPYTFQNDKGEKVESEFGTLLVPENRSNPQSNLIELAFVRFKSTAKNPGAADRLSRRWSRRHRNRHGSGHAFPTVHGAA